MLDHTHIVQAGLKKLSSKLESLDLRFWNAEQVLLDIETAPNSQSVRRRIWPISDYLPNLRILKISTSASKGGLVDADFGDLPNTLTELLWSTSSDQITEAMLRYLSPKITKLTFSVPLTETGILSIPPTIEYLHCTKTVPLNLFRLLPKSLNHFECLVWSFKTSELPLVPVGFKSITWQHDGEENLSVNVPRHVKTLNVRGKCQNYLERPGFLPSGLLVFHGTGVRDLAAVPWPSSLVSLTLGVVRLQYLIGRLPVGLVELSIKTAFTDDESFEDLANSLSPRLERLTIWVYNESPVDGVEIHFPVFRLPLKTLQLLGEAQTSWEYFESLPRTLESLLIDSSFKTHISDPQLFSHLPPLLTSLSLTGTHSANKSCLLYLNRSLIHLTVDVAEHMVENDFFALPRGLKDLSIGSCPSIAFNAFNGLPQSLNTLTVSMISEAVDISLLHRRLQYLSLPYINMTLSSKEIADLPRSLISIYINSALPEEDCDWPEGILHIRGLSGPRFPPAISQHRQAFQAGSFTTPDPRVIARFQDVSNASKG
jgi:hypothetical protein